MRAINFYEVLKYLSKENKIQSGDIDISEFADFIDSLDLDNLGK